MARSPCKMVLDIRTYLEMNSQGEENAKSPKAIARGIFGNDASQKLIQEVSSRLSNMHRSTNNTDIQRKPGRTPKRYWYFIQEKQEEPEAEIPTRLPETPSEPILDSESITNRFLDSLADKLADKLLERMGPLFTETQEAIISHMKSTLPGAILEEPSKTQTKLPKITVVGPLPGQGRRIKSEFRGLAKIRIVHSFDKATIAGEAAKHADLTVLWTNYIGHDVEKTLKSMGVKPLRITGGPEQIINKVTEWLLTEGA